MPKDTRNGAAHEPASLGPHSRLGHELIPLHRWDHRDQEDRERGKSPRDAGWRTADYSGFDAEAHMAAGGNVGVRLRAADLVVDVDPRNFAGGDDPLARLCEDVGLDPDSCPTVITGSGGRHLYLSKPEGAALVNSLEGYSGVEFKSLGAQVVAAGSVHPNGDPYRWDPLTDASEPPPAPERLLALARKAIPTDSAGAGGEHTPEQVAAMLARLDPRKFASNDRWLELMFAVHHASDGAAWHEFLDWSARDGGYASKHGENRKRWDSAHARRPGGITTGTLYKALREAGAADAIPMQTAQEDFEGEPLELPAGALAPPARLTSISDLWVYVADAHAFVRRSDGKKYGPEQWKALHASAWPEGDVLNAVWKDKLRVRKCEALVYVPCEPEFPTPATYNIWKPSGVEARPGDVGPLVEHAEYLLPDAAERDLALDYLALLVQRPAEKIMFALLIRGLPGTGKSWLGQLMARIIGRRNAIWPSNEEVLGRWTAWTEGHQLAVIDELMTLGRLEVVNRLKPIITEPELRIENKNCKLYSIPNHLNLLCFTNHKNALRIEHSDRRWLVMFSPSKERERAYYDRLFAFLEGDGPAAAKHWLMQRQVRMDPKGRAPQTLGKEEMQRLSMGDLESHLLALFEERQHPFDFDLVRFESVVGSVPRSVRSSDLRARVDIFLKDEIGAVCHPRYTKGDRPSYTLWSVRDHERWAEEGAAGRIDAFMAHASKRVDGL